MAGLGVLWELAGGRSGAGFQPVAGFQPSVAAVAGSAGRFMGSRLLGWVVITVQGMEGGAAHPLLCELQAVLFRRPPGKCGLFLGHFSASITNHVFSKSHSTKVST